MTTQDAKIKRAEAQLRRAQAKVRDRLVKFDRNDSHSNLEKLRAAQRARDLAREALDDARAGR